MSHKMLHHCQRESVYNTCFILTISISSPGKVGRKDEKRLRPQEGCKVRMKVTLHHWRELKGKWSQQK